MKNKIVFILFSLLMTLAILLSACSPQAVNDDVNVENQNEEEITESTNINEESENQGNAEEVAVEEAAEMGETATLHLASAGEPDTLDPHKTGSGNSDLILDIVGASLVALDIDGNILPYLAESWDVSEDGLTYTFHLRNDVLFHDGTPLTAQDFVYTYERALDPEIASPSTATMLGSVEDLAALDDTTLVITLSEPNYPFLFSLAETGYMQPMLQSYVEEAGDELGRHPISVGPYKMVEWVTGDHILLERNPDFCWGDEYYGEGPARIDFIEIQFLPEKATILAGLEAGEIDWAMVERNDAAFLDERGFDILKQPIPGMSPYIAFNVQTAPLDDINIRIAINKAIDRIAALEILEQGEGVVMYGPLSPAQIGYSPEVENHGYPYDPEGAKALIEEAGYSLNENGIYEKDGELLSFSIYTIPINNYPKAAEVFQSMLAEVGIQTEIVQEEPGVSFARLVAGDYQMAITGMGWQEADLMYMMFHSTQIGGFNFAFVENPELDSLLESTRTLVDPVERQQAVEDAQIMIAEQAYFVPVYASMTYEAINPRVKDYVVIPIRGVSFTKAYIEE